MKMNSGVEWKCLALSGREPVLGLSGLPGTPCAGSGSPWVPPHGQQSVDVADECYTIEPVPPAEMKSGFYSPYFIVPKKSAIDLKDAYFHVSILPRHRPFLRFSFEGRAYQYKGIRILNYLDDWLIIAHSRDLLCEHRVLVLRHLSHLGLRVNREKSKLFPVQRISFLGMELDSVNMTACLTNELMQSVLNCLKLFRHKTAVPLKTFQRLLGHMAATAAVTPLGLPHMRPLQRWLHDRVPRWAWHRGTLRIGVSPQCRRLFSPWSDPAFLRAGVCLGQVSRHVVVHTDASTTGWGAVCNGQAASGSWTGPRLLWHINCQELLAVLLALRRFLPMLRHKHVLVRTDNTTTVVYINRQGGLRSRRMSQLARHLLLWSQTRLKSLRAVHIPGELNRAADQLSRQPIHPGEWRLHPQTRVGDLQAFSVNEACLEFGPADSHVVLRPRPGYVPKVPTTPFRDQVVNLQALPPEEADPAIALLCPVRALRIYVDRTRSFRRSEQLFICFGGQQKGNAVSKQRLAHWVVDAISLAYEGQGEPCPLGVRAHSTRSVASSYALAHGASLADICRAAGWVTPNTFARFYNLRVEPVSSRVLR
ncbi:enzymatic polyprotein [Labeo rohita]|uniref:ribonuclease H n=1 Tax=Labeo rohita TaxID=84645 RepID=A0ABQ8KZ35_LABRO|nr:enzymatic polyprotein [Labeo rohita]